MEPATVVTTSPLTVRIDSSATAVPALKINAYTTPVVGDRVAVERLSSRLLVIGKVV